MVMMVETPRTDQKELELGEYVYAIAQDNVARRTGTTRLAFDVNPNNLQGSDRLEEFEFRLDSWQWGHGFSYAEVTGVYDQSDKWYAAVPGELATWGEHQVGATFTSDDYRGWLVFHEGYLYVFRGVNAVKYEVTGEFDATISKVETTDLSALANADASSVVSWLAPPVAFKGNLYIPLVNASSGSGQRFAVLSNVVQGGSGDTFAVATTHIDARGFTLWTHPISGPVIVAWNGNTIALCSGDPTVSGNWTPTPYEVGDSGFAINSVASYDTLLLVGKADGRLYNFDSQARSQEVPDVGEAPGSIEDFVGMQTVQGFLLAPHTEGLWRYRPGSGRLVGAEQDGQLDATVSNAWGRIMGLARYGRSTYFTQQNNYAGVGMVGFFTPAGDQGPRGPLTPHVHRMFNFPVEHCAIAGERPAVELEPAAYALADSAVTDNAVGTVTLTGMTSLTGDNFVGENLIPYGEFEDAGDVFEPYWQRTANDGAIIGTASGVTLATSTDYAKSGSRSLKVVTPGSYIEEGVESQGEAGFAVITNPGAVHVASLYVRAALGANLKLIIRDRNAGGANLQETNETFVGTGDWQLVTKKWTPPALTAKVRYEIVTTGTLATTFYVDDVELIEGDIAYVDDAHSWYAALTDFDQAVPDSATILGIEVEGYIRGRDTSASAHNVLDGTIRLIKGGVISGNDLGDATPWASSWVKKTWGGISELAGVAWTPSDINGTGFGVAFSVDATPGQGQIAYIKARVHYTISTGSTDTSGYLAVLTTDVARTTVTPRIFKLSRAGLAPSADPNIDGRKVAGAEFRAPRFYRPGREILKHYREVQFHLEADPQTNTPGVQVWASIDNGTEFQLEVNAEAASPVGATFRTTGLKTAYFPIAKTSGRQVQLRFKIPELAGVEEKMRAKVRDVVIRGSYRTTVADEFQWVIDIKQTPRRAGADNLASDLRTPEAIRAALEALNSASAPPTPYRAPGGRSGYCEVTSVRVMSAKFLEDGPLEEVAVVTARKAPYG